MTMPRYAHSSTTLADGSVFVAGGEDLPGRTQVTAEVFNPSSNTWHLVGRMQLSLGRSHHTATLLQTGKVLVVGGCMNPYFGPFAEVYDPVSNSWSGTGDMSKLRYSGFTATPLKDGRVIVVGGTPDTLSFLQAAEVYDPRTNAWSDTDPLNAGRAFHSSTLLKDGRLLILGGENGYIPEFWKP